MDAIRPLRDVFAGLAGGESDALRDQRLDDLPDDLLTEAIVSYVDTAPAEVAAHLAPFVTAHSSVGQAGHAGEHGDVTQGLHLLASAPIDLELNEAYEFDGVGSLDGLPEIVAPAGDGDAVLPDPVQLGFGHGHDVLAYLDDSEGLERDHDGSAPAADGLEEDMFADGPIAVDAPDIAVADDLAGEPGYGAGLGTPDGDEQPPVGGGDDDTPDA